VKYRKEHVKIYKIGNIRINDADVRSELCIPDRSQTVTSFNALWSNLLLLLFIFTTVHLLENVIAIIRACHYVPLRNLVYTYFYLDAVYVKFIGCT